MDGLDGEFDITSFYAKTQTPSLLFTAEIIYMMSNISSLVNTKWYLGIPLNDTHNLRLAIAEYGNQILGDNLLGLQVGNEPDLYSRCIVLLLIITLYCTDGTFRHGHRPASYGPYDYFGEFGQVVEAIKADANIHTSNNLIGPSISSDVWTPERTNLIMICAYRTR